METYNFYKYHIVYSLEEVEDGKYTKEEKGLVYGESYGDVMRKIEESWEDKLVSVKCLENIDSINDLLPDFILKEAMGNLFN